MKNLVDFENPADLDLQFSNKNVYDSLLLSANILDPDQNPDLDPKCLTL